MLLRTFHVSTRTLLQAAAVAVFVLVGAGAAKAANQGNPPLLVPYTIETVAGTPQFPFNTSKGPTGYAGDGGLATPAPGFCDQAPALGVGAGTGACPALSSPYGVAIDSVGNVYFTDTGNDVIREVNEQTGILNTIAGQTPKGCSGIACSNKFTGCSDGVAALGNPIGGKLSGIAVDAYGNIYFADNALDAVWVIYRGGTQVANLIAAEAAGEAGTVQSGVTDPTQVKVGYVYHIAGALASCVGNPGNTDSVLATTGQLRSPQMITLDSAGNIYIADTGNQTVRVINTQATPQTFFQYTVQPYNIQSITNCNAAITIACPTTTTSTVGTGINGPANGLVFTSQYKGAQADQYGNVYQINGTGGGTGAPGIYVPVAYAGGSPLTNLLTAEAPLTQQIFPGTTPPTYGTSYPVIGLPGSANTSLNAISSPYIEQAVGSFGSFDVRPSDVTADIYGTLWFMDNHYPYIERIDQYSENTLYLVGNNRPISGVSFTPSKVISGLDYNNSASFQNQWFCVYGATGNPGNPWTQGPRTPDPMGDGCPAIIANIGLLGTSSNIPQVKTDGPGNVYMTDGSNGLVREVLLDNVFPATPLAGSASAAPVTQGIQIHFDASNPPIPKIGDFKATVGTNVYLAEFNGTNGVQQVFSVVSAGGDFSVDTTTPEFAIGTLSPTSGFKNSSTTTGWGMWPPNSSTVGVPTCYQYALAYNDTSYDCLVYVKFNPTGPGLRTGQLKVTTLNGSTYSFPLSGIGQGSQLAIDGGQQTTYLASGLGATSSVAVSPTGTVYIADKEHSRIVSCPPGAIPCTTPTAVPQPSSLSPSGLSGPMGVATDAAGNVYVADTGNNRVLEYNPVTTVWSVLGNYNWIPGASCDGGGGSSSLTNCPSSLAGEPGAQISKTTPPPQYQFKTPQGLAVDKNGNVFVADTGNKAIVEIPQNTSLGGAVQMFQYPNAPTFSNPVAVAVDSNGFIYVADTGNVAGNIVRIPPGGGDLESAGGNPYSALFDTLQSFSGESVTSPVTTPNGVAVDAANNVYVSDASTNQVWVVPALSGSSAAPYMLNFVGLNQPAGLALDSSGNLYVADSGNNQILFTNRQNPLINFGTVPQFTGNAQPICPNTQLSDGLNIQGNTPGCLLTVTNIGNQTVPLTSPVTSVTGISPAGSIDFAVTNTCGSTLPAGATCTVSPTFTPTADGPQSENVNINGTNSMALVATTNAVGAQPLANIVLTSSAGLTPAANSTPVITATLSQPHIPNNVPTGTVTFTYAIDAKTSQATKCGSGGTATVALNGGVATFTLPALGQGLQYTVSANYSGDSQSSATQAVPLVLTVPGITESYVAASASYTYGQTVPVISGTIAPALPAGVTATFVPGGAYNTAIPGASQFSAVANSPYPIQVVFTGTNACAYGFPTVLTSGGAPAVVTENPAPLTMTVGNFSTVYGAQAANFFSTNEISGAVGNDLAKLSATFTPPDTSVLDVVPAAPSVNPYPVVATLIGKPVTAGNYTIKYVNGTDKVTPAPSGITVSQSGTSVLVPSQNSVSFALLASTLVTAGKGIPTGTITVTDNFVPITGTVFGPSCSTTLTTNCNPSQSLPACTATQTANCITPTVPLTVGGGTFTLPGSETTTLPGTHNFTFTYNGDAGTNGDGLADFQCSVAGGPATSSCPTTAAKPYSLIVDYPDVNLTSNTGPLIIVPGVTPSGLGLQAAPGQNSAYPETAAISINPILGFKGTVTLGCTTQNPVYVNCTMLPPSITISGTSASTAILSVSTPANLPLGTKTSALRTATGRTVLAFLPFGMLAFCFRRRKRLSQVLLALMVLVGMSAGMSGCSASNQTAYFTPIPAGQQFVTVTASYQSTGNFCSSPTATCTVVRSFVVPITIE
jgi:sugar lactone lactonase YvrE